MSAQSPKDIVLLVHAQQGALAPSAAQLLSLARRLREVQPGAIKAVLAGEGLETAARALCALGLDEVILLEGPGLAAYSGPAWVEALTPLLRELDPAWVLAAHDSQGLDHLPVLSLRLEAALLGPVEGLETAPEAPLFRCPGHGGKALISQRSLSATTLLGVLPGAFAAAEPVGEPAALKRLASPVKAEGVTHLGELAGHGQSRELEQAQRVLSVGRGIGGRDNLPLAEEAAACLGAVLAGSRPLCDLGWLPYQRQVGQTGATVTPRLYLAVGISGARQHTLGMQGADFIVAVNTDPQAPIHDLADLSLPVDAPSLLKALVEACRQAK